jgi:hypothetical protein
MTEGDKPPAEPTVPVPPVPPVAASGIVVSTAADDKKANNPVMAARATEAAVRETEAMVMTGDWALTVFVRGTEVQRMGFP